MPEGRFVSKSISTSEQLGEVSLEADFLFGRCIPHLDVDGRITGNPKGLKAIVAPLRDELSHQKITHLLKELAEAGLVVWYEVNGSRYLEFPTFVRHQKGMHRDREAASKIPSSAAPEVNRVFSQSAKSAEEVRTNSGVGQDLVRLSKVKGSEVKESTSEVKVLGSVEPNRVSWVVDGATWWAKNVGVVTHPHFGKALKQAVDTHGWPKVFPALRCYADDARARGKPAKLEWFAGEIVRWIEWAHMPATDENGDLTPRGKAIVAGVG